MKVAETETEADLNRPSTSTSSRPQRCVQIPAGFRDDNGTDDDDQVLCALCNPSGVVADTVIWIDYDVCGTWVHNFCAFNNNTASTRYRCKDCSS